LIAGYADTVSGARMNAALSGRFAVHGVPLSEMAVNGHGENNLAVPTGNNVPQQQNRRVEIDIP
jgi:outer membrane protein OmpA-like peptidoglycan-associated protein